MDILLQQLINGLTLGSVYALVALGYTMVYGIIGLINFAHGEVVMIGAMVSLSVVTALLGMHVPLPSIAVILVGLLVAIAVCMAIAYAMEKIAYARCARRRASRRSSRPSACRSSCKTWR